MSGLKGIFKSASIVSGNNVLVSGFNFLTFLLMFNALGTFGFGLYTLAISFLSFATFFVDTGLSKVVVADVSKYLNEKREKSASGLFKGYVFYVTLIAFLTTVLSLIFAEPIASYLGRDISTLIQLIGILIFLSGLKSIYSTSFEITAEFKKFASFRFLDSLIKLIFVFVTVTFIGSTVENVLGALIIAEILLIIGFFLQIPKTIKKLFRNPDSDKNLFFEMIKRHGKWAAVFSQVRSFDSNILFWIVEFFLGVSAVGIFSALLKIQNMFIRIFEPLETIFYPFVSKLGNIKDSSKTIFRATKYTFYLSIPIVLGAMIFSSQLIQLVLGSEFGIYANEFRVLLLVVFVVIFNTPLKPLFFNLKAQKLLTGIGILILVSTLLISSFLTFSMGIMGMAISRVLIHTFFDVGTKMYFLKKRMKESISFKQLVVIDEFDKNLVKRILKMN